MRFAQGKSPFGFLNTIWLGIVCTVLLIVNFELVRSLVEVSGFRDLNAKGAQLVQFFVPVILIVIEFWLYDFLTDRAELQAEMDAPSEPKQT
jgi:hypothetical protein